MAELLSTTPNLRPLTSSFAGRLSADILLYLGTTFIYLVLTAASTFIIPRLFTVEAFGTYRLFLLYAGFVGVLHLGSLDGALARWARDPQLVSKEYKAAAVSTVLVSVPLAVLAALFAFLFAGRQYAPVVITLVPFAVLANIGTAAQFSLQAQRRFEVLSALNALGPVILLTGILAAAGLGNHNSNSLLACYLLAAGCTTIVSWRFAVVHSSSARIKTWKFLSANTAIGFFILLSNFSTNLMLALDRLVVSFRFTLGDFAIYSFAASVLYSVNTLVLSAGRVFFPHMCAFEGDKGRISGIAAKVVLVTWVLGLAFFFPAAWLVRSLLPQYINSVPIIRILLLAAGPASLVQIVHFSQFRAAGNERRLLLGAAVGLLCCSVALVLVRPYSSLTTIAWAAVAGHFAWWLTNEFLMNDHKRRRHEVLHTALLLLLSGATFYYCSGEVGVPNVLAYIFLLPVAVVFAWEPELALRFSQQTGHSEGGGDR